MLAVHLIDGKRWGMNDSRHSLIHIVEAERHWWACTNWKIPSREEDLRHKNLLTTEEYEIAHTKHHHIWCWENDVCGMSTLLLDHINGGKTDDT